MPYRSDTTCRGEENTQKKIKLVIEVYVCEFLKCFAVESI